jgi:hypothetical protein
MKKYLVICGMLAALTWVGVAAAATPQGKLTGAAFLAGMGQFDITAPILDGGTTYLGLENDNSGSCSNDSGTTLLAGFLPEPVVCAHFVASSRDGSGPKMRFAFRDPESINPGCYDIFRISDAGARGTDKVGVGFTCSLALAQAWVNKGYIGKGVVVGVNPFVYLTVTGDYTITASQT